MQYNIAYINGHLLNSLVVQGWLVAGFIMAALLFALPREETSISLFHLLTPSTPKRGHKVHNTYRAIFGTLV